MNVVSIAWCRLTNSQKRLYRRLQELAGRGGGCYAPEWWLAGELGTSARQVRRDLRRLYTWGLLRWAGGVEFYEIAS